jgi:hypothetical protein
LHGYRFLDVDEIENDRSLDRGANPNPQAGFVVRLESLYLDVQDVHAGGQCREPQLPPFVRGHGVRSADERRRADPDDGPGKDGPLGILYGADQRSSEGLSPGRVRMHDAGDGEGQNECHAPAHGGSPLKMWARPPSREPRSENARLPQVRSGDCSCPLRGRMSAALFSAVLESVASRFR